MLPPDYPAPIRDLAERLHRLEILLGTSQAYPELEDEVVGVAHRLRNELTVWELSRHLSSLRG